jgi:hypothetical protein
MHVGKLVFAQLTEHLPLTTFRRCVALYAGEHKIKNFTCLEQFLCLAFAQLTYRESLRDIEACLRAQRDKLCHMGIRSRISRSTLADANEPVTIAGSPSSTHSAKAGSGMGISRFADRRSADQCLNERTVHRMFQIGESIQTLSSSVRSQAVLISFRSERSAHAGAPQLSQRRMLKSPPSVLRTENPFGKLAKTWLPDSVPQSGP